jgi:hypothetical protein
MAEPVSLRVLEIVRQWFADDPTFVTVGLDLRDYTNDLTAVDKPAVFVIRGAPEAALTRETEGGIVEPLAVDLVCYAEAPTVDPDTSEPIVPPAVTVTRERLYQAVLTRLYEEDSGESLVSRLQADRVLYGNGAELFEHVAPPLTDQGYEPPHAILEIPCRALLHYQDRSF